MSGFTVRKGCLGGFAESNASAGLGRPIDPSSRSEALIASVSDFGQYPGEVYDWQQKKGVVQAYLHPLYVGPSRQDMANLSGVLHLTMNAPIMPPPAGAPGRAGSVKLWVLIWP